MTWFERITKIAIIYNNHGNYSHSFIHLLQFDRCLLAIRHVTRDVLRQEERFPQESHDNLWASNGEITILSCGPVCKRTVSFVSSFHFPEPSTSADAHTFFLRPHLCCCAASQVSLYRFKQILCTPSAVESSNSRLPLGLSVSVTYRRRGGHGKCF